MDTTLAVIPRNWTILSLSSSAGPMIHWMNSPEGNHFHFYLITSLIGSLHIMMMMVIITTMMIDNNRNDNIGDDGDEENDDDDDGADKDLCAQ